MSTTLIRSAALALLTAAGMIGAAEAARAQHFTLEDNIDRMGGDYTRSVLAPEHDRWQTCEAMCRQQPECKAFTYVRPHTIQGPQGVCWLKSSVPEPRASDCCVSGVKAEPAACQLAGKWSGADWGTVILSGGPHSYSGTYTRTTDGRLGFIQITSSRAGTWSGYWSDGIWSGNVTLQGCTKELEVNWSGTRGRRTDSGKSRWTRLPD